VTSSVFVAACDSPSDKITEAREKVTSSVETLSLAARAWARGAVPAHFIQRLSEDTGSDLESAKRSLEGISSKDADALRSAIDALEPLEGTLAQMIEAGDKEAATRATEMLMARANEYPNEPL
jgi:hypothetical protein